MMQMQNGRFVNVPLLEALQAGLGDLLPANTPLMAYLGLSHKCLEPFGALALQSVHSPTDEPSINAAEAVQSRNMNKSQQMHSSCVDEEMLIKKKKAC